MGLEVGKQNARYFKIITVNMPHLISIFGTKCMYFKKFHWVGIR